MDDVLLQEPSLAYAHTHTRAQDAAEPMLPRPFMIERRRKEAGGCFTLWLRDPTGQPFNFRVGQFNMLYVYGVGEVPISIAGDASDPSLLMHTIRGVGAVTDAMGRLKVGDTIGVRGPFGNGWPLDAAVGQDVFFVTSTVGLAPLRGLILETLARREEFGKVVLAYGSRGIHDCLYENDLHAWRARFDMTVYVTAHSAPIGYRGQVGSVAHLIERAEFDPPNTVAFVCRSEAMLPAAFAALEARGVAPDRFYTTMERNMKCAVGFCGHCQRGPTFMCRQGPVYRYSDIQHLFAVREL
ncbi:FAD/NAD(P)-binding protein [Consotaella salsifontis]|uniref:NAD(P)H-flavin reductase n=1 Tax=Consotaella salsifontis TaxID=1365950 RepID=A0A1T4SHP2_9HYPH|nr:FAD/NAD(P)-binding protein [Consotaella salsifontis]SKA27820.1 NAD(P)H-flavin reductase [Consotaella salsifontis]